jgi:hypothetical protein
MSIEFGTGDVHENVLSDAEFHENWRSENHTLFTAISEYLSIL